MGNQVETGQMTKLYLSAIVKNEAHIIRRMLESVRPYISGYLICDTGSTDGTQDIIRECLSDLPGEVIDRPWIGFGHNKSEALEYGRQRFGKEWYALIIDADEQLEVPDGWKFPELTEPVYNLNFRLGMFVWGRSALFSNSIQWRYEGVLHEAPVCPELDNVVQRILPGPVVNSYSDGARSQQDITEKYAKDAITLEKAMAEDPTNTRHQFYLAQSYRDSVQFEKALSAYEMRVAMGGWPEEVYWSLLEIGRLHIRMQHDADTIKKAYLRASRFRPERIEAAVELASFLRFQEQPQSAYILCKKVLDSPYPENDVLFVSPSWWTWRRYDEFSMNAGLMGDFHTAIEYTHRALAGGDLDQENRERLQNNLAFWQSQVYNKATA